MSQDPSETRLKRLEQRINILLGVSVAQMILLALIAVSYFIPNLYSIFQLFIFLSLLGAAAYLFRAQIPGWFGNASRYVFSHLKDAEK